MNLKRVLEPEVMDTAEEARDYNAMDHSDVNRSFIDDFLAAGFESGDVLDLGTGTALIPIELCKRLEQNDVDYRIMAADAAAHMLDLARLNIESQNLQERIQLAQIDAKNMNYADGMFDAVMSNSIIHHLPEPISCLKESVRITKPGGLLFFRDLLRPENDETVQELVQTYTGEENEHSQKMFDESLRAALTLDEIGEMIESLGFARSSVTQTSDRHWTWVARKPAS